MPHEIVEQNDKVEGNIEGDNQFPVENVEKNDIKTIAEPLSHFEVKIDKVALNEKSDIKPFEESPIEVNTEVGHIKGKATSDDLHNLNECKHINNDTPKELADKSNKEKTLTVVKENIPELIPSESKIHEEPQNEITGGYLIEKRKDMYSQ